MGKDKKVVYVPQGAMSEVYDEYEQARKISAKLQKKKAKIERKLRAIDLHSAVLWELAGVYGELERAEEAQEAGEEYVLNHDRNVVGDMDVVYTHIDPKYYEEQQRLHARLPDLGF